MTEAGWHPDPHHRHELRWWDGSAWTDHVSDGGVTSVESTPVVAPSSFAPPTAGLPPAGFPASGQPMMGQQPVGQQPVGQQPFGQPAMGQPGAAPVLPVQPGGPDPDKGGRGLWVAGVLGLLAVGIGVAVFVSLGGDDESASTATDETVDDTTGDSTDDTTYDTTGDSTDPSVVIVETTMVDTTVPFTLPPGTVAPSTVPVTEAPTTVPATTVPAVPTIDVLVGALPTAAEVPFGFTASLDAPDTDFSPASGQGVGLCGGDNSDGRARSANVVARAWTAPYTAPSGRLWVGLFSFASAADASSFMSITAVQATSCGAGLTFQVPESDWDIFSDDLETTWNVVENAGAQPATTPAEEAFQLSTQFVSTTRLDGVNYSSSDGDLIQYERYGQIVLVVDRAGSWAPAGFGNIDPAAIYQPTAIDVANLADVLRGPVLDRLRAAGVAV